MTTPSPNPQPSPERPPDKPQARTEKGPAEPSRTPPAVAQPPDWEYSGIDPELMHAFERDLGQAESTLGRHEPRIRRTLEDLDLDTSRLNALRELGNWIGAKRPELRRRNETIQAAKPEWGAVGAGGLAPFDEHLYSAASSQPDVYAAALKLREVDRNGEVDEKTVAELEKRAGDAGFATSLMYALGTERFRHLMAALVYHKDERRQRLQAALGKTLGAASPRLSESWRKELLDHLRVPVDQHALAAVLPYGKFSRDFLVAAAKTLEGLDRKTWNEKPATGIPHDPMIGVMKALANHPKAAQDVFVGDPGIMKRYVTERRMHDDGAAFGAALEAATMTYRDRDGSPPEPSPGFISAKIASDFIRWEAERVLAGTEGPAFATTGSAARIISAYINDVNRIAEAPKTGGKSSVFVNDRPHLLASDQLWGAQFEKPALHKVMEDVFKHDAKALATVMAAQIAWSRKLIDHGAAQAAAGKSTKSLLANIRETGAGLGLITHASGLAKIELGTKLDEQQERNMKVFMAAVNTGLGIPQTAAWAITATTLGSWTSLIEDSAKTDLNRVKATYEANIAMGEAHYLHDQLIADAMLRNGLFGKSEPAAPTHPWGSLDGVEKGDDPRKSPNNFLKDDGNSLMTQHEMAPYPGDVQPRLDAYQTWLYDGLAGQQWNRARNESRWGFEDGKPEHQ
ncbi:hypothetical protein [Nonomuraea sp. C10]|uniref:hypothetical protein n=1 Tax=Nonomuraea sp. C10 TaxID=2600577 RepID=UPI0011CE5424|nr:hypothetical protein [Nonomuraea sp. C10]TXK39826.1 hypothetical protein FR742_09675 [Nonomuraea sp. C10]